MKFTLTFKCPDVLDSLKETVFGCGKEVGGEDDHFYPQSNCVDCEKLETDTLKEQEAKEECAKEFVLYGEMITVVFDTEKKMAEVLHVSKVSSRSY